MSSCLALVPGHLLLNHMLCIFVKVCARFNHLHSVLQDPSRVLTRCFLHGGVLTSRKALGAYFTDRAFNFPVIRERTVSHYTENGNISLLHNALPWGLITNYQICWHRLNIFGERRFMGIADGCSCRSFHNREGVRNTSFPTEGSLGPDKCTAAEVSFLALGGGPGCHRRRAGSQRWHFKTLCVSSAFESVCCSYQNTSFFFFFFSQMPQCNKHMLHF